MAGDGSASDPADALDAWTHTASSSSLTAGSDGSTSIGLAWDGGNYSQFMGPLPDTRIYRSSDGGQSFTQVAETDPYSTSFTDTGLTPASRYVYQVHLGAGNHISGTSPTASAYTGPAAPAGFSATATPNAVSLSWANASNLPDTYQVQVERSDDGGWTYNTIGTTGATSFTDTNVSPDNSYLYQLQGTMSGGVTSDIGNALGVDS